jgi:hypothetical protein
MFRNKFMSEFRNVRESATFDGISETNLKFEVQCVECKQFVPPNEIILTEVNTVTPNQPRPKIEVPFCLHCADM